MTSKGLMIEGKYGEFPLNRQNQGKNFLDILLIHAFPFDSEMYVQNFEQDTLIKQLEQLSLNKGKIRIFLPDLPGFGSSESFTSIPEDLIPYAEIINEFVRQYNVKNLILGGCSMGGYIALEYARNRPEYLNGLILIDTRTNADDEQQRENRMKTVKMLTEILKKVKNGNDKKWITDNLYLKSPEIQNFIDGLYSKIVSKEIIQKDPKIGEKMLNIMKRQSVIGIIHALSAMAERKDTTDVLKQFERQVLIIVGEKDQITPLEIAKKMNDEATSSTLEIIASAGHLSNMDCISDFNTKLIDWLGKF